MDVTKKNILSTLKKMKKHERSATYLKKIFTQASKEGLNINERYEQGKNILHYTIEGGYDNLINFFIKLGLNPDICDDNFVSPLHLAVNKNNKKAVKKLLKAGSDVDCAPFLGGRCGVSRVRFAARPFLFAGTKKSLKYK